MKLIYIEWQDAHSFDSGWTSKKTLNEYVKGEEFIVKQVGWIYKETKRFLVLVTQYVEEGEYLADGYGGIIKIPKGWIKRRIKLTIPKL